MKARTVGIGIIWTLFYMPFVGYVIDLAFGYTPFGSVLNRSATGEVRLLNPFEDWAVLYRAFMYDQWVINTLTDFALFLSFLLFIPLWGLGWFWMLKVNWWKKWSALFHFSRHKEMEKGHKFPLKKKVLVRPPALPAGAFLNRNFPSPAPATTRDGASAEADASVPSSMPPNTELTPEITAGIKELGERFGFELFRNVQLDDVIVPLVLATDTKALLLKLLTTENEWIADETIAEGSEAPTWFSSDGVEPSPFFEVKQAALSLAQKEPESAIIPVVVVLKGHIINAEAMLPEWQAAGGYVVRFGEGQPEILMTLENLLEQEA